MLKGVVGAIVVACGLVVAATAARADDIVDRVLAVVSGDVILLSDVDAARAFGLLAPPGSDPVGSVLSQLIDRELVLAEVERYAPPEPPASAVDRELEQVRRRFPSAQAFDAALARTGIDLSHLRETLRENLRIRAYLDQRFTVLSPTEEEVRRYFLDHPAEFTVGGTLRKYEDARPDAAAAWVAARRKALVDEWVGGLRRRTDIIDLYLPSPRPPA
jgi:peptidyl-prolyl cis-trans isomerase SurA